MEKRVLVAVLMVCGLVVGCSRQEQPRRSVAEYAKKLRPLIEAVPKSVIDLDAVEPDTIYPDMVIPRDTVAREGGLYLASPEGLVVMGDSLYISDRLNHCVVVADMQGNLVRTIGRQGRGPGEFIQPWEMAANERLVCVRDIGNGRVQVFDHAFRLQGSVPSRYGPSYGGVAASERKLFVYHHGEGTLVNVHEARPPFKLEYSFAPLVVPEGQQPTAMNVVVLASSSEGCLCLGYICLPYLFVFDSTGRQFASIEFRGKEVARLDEPLGQKVYGAPPGALVRSFVSGLRILPGRTVLVAILVDRDPHLLVLAYQDNKYWLRKRFRLADSRYGESYLYHAGKVYVCLPDRGRIHSYPLDGGGP